MLTYLHGDALGSASLATSVTGTVVSSLRYYPYGGTRSGSMATDRRYTGQRWEGSVGFYDYGARSYDPALGRFVQSDVVIPQRGDPQSLNRYAYVRNNPFKYVDETGHCWGIANGIRNLPTYGTTCNNLDMALTIAQHPEATAAQKAGAVAYIAAEGTAHTVVLVGGGILAWKGAAAAISAIGGTGAAVTLSKVGEVAAGAACVDGDCTDEVRDGLNLLERTANTPRIWSQFRLGYQAELERAKYWASTGRLTNIEQRIPNGRLDLTLMNNQAVEVKYWTQTYAAANLQRLGDQLLKYQNAGYNMILEMASTKTDPITLEYWQQHVVPFLEGIGVTLGTGSGLVP